jgi:hypothetical protein
MVCHELPYKDVWWSVFLLLGAMQTVALTPHPLQNTSLPRHRQAVNGSAAAIIRCAPGHGSGIVSDK